MGTRRDGITEPVVPPSISKMLHLLLVLQLISHAVTQAQFSLGEKLWARGGLRAHNEKLERIGHPLKLDEGNSLGCKEYAKELANRDRGVTDSSGNDLYKPNINHGQNLDVYPGPAATAQASVDTWYSEKNSSHPRYTRTGTNHYTQVVWKSSTWLCMASAQSRTGKVYVVAFYSPAGNFGFGVKDNVEGSIG